MTDTTSTITDTSEAGLDRVMAAAEAAAPVFGGLRPAERAAMLRRAAAELDAAADELVPIAMAESHLPEARCRGELARTTFQLRLFAETVEEGSYLEAAIDTADPDWGMGPRPDVRRMLVPLGPVVVFGASNFPFAFSTAGGDTASALAAGCPVVVKAHPGHPRLARRTGEVVAKALGDAGAPEGVFAVVFGQETGRRAVLHPRTAAVGFTGSIPGGRALHDLAASRPRPIPFYGELGSLNPVFVTRAALAARGDAVLSGYADSFTLGSGQFCTKPGVLLVPEGTGLEALAADVAGRAASRLLNERVTEGFETGLAELTGHRVTEVLVRGAAAEGDWTPTLLRTDAASLLEHRDVLLEECFGPTSLVVTYTDEEQLVEVAGALEGQLTATVQAEDGDAVAARLLAVLTEKAGRVLWNGWPTGVSVTHAMTHGGPYPATTSVLHTSVGTTAIRRFLRPVTYQSVPQPLLPEALRDDNPLGLPRRVNGAPEAG
ncbi:NADP-dependent aldehyde dehydrogenase [Spinactinospora alkalitolerans]|uniref:NADP-dependent aldehyde dehydrogenase n=1 Tax=Spinactinospora alkalitolerans TaxID=687207 RepID=A0A852TMX2_9ACTN|nr:aldehyde dehydrogenase (NADP(+)) [Spinactinospora alkalitolerans]NYE44935.1 NADP-dependent aldehyde dehydrogenase [Spinactinospora alkalitolerans]